MTVAMITGFSAYNIGLMNATMPLNEKGYYFSIILLELFAAIAIQKNVRDNNLIELEENI